MKNLWIRLARVEINAPLLQSSIYVYIILRFVNLIQSPGTFGGSGGW